ncbi:type II toxin-antitoxin system PemK/MazF family toxin [Virgibacillus kimchii]
MRVKRGGIYFANLGEQDGSSIQKGIRPGIIVQSELGNKHSTTTIFIPLSSKNKGLPMHVEIKPEDCNDGQLNNTSYALCEQIRVISIQSIHNKICSVSDSILNKIYFSLMIATGFTVQREKEKKFEVV